MEQLVIPVTQLVPKVVSFPSLYAAGRVAGIKEVVGVGFVDAERSKTLRISFLGPFDKRPVTLLMSPFRLELTICIPWFIWTVEIGLKSAGFCIDILVRLGRGQTTQNSQNVLMVLVLFKGRCGQMARRWGSCLLNWTIWR